MPRWLKGKLPTDDYQIKFYDTRTSTPKLHYASNIGPQTWALLCPYDELCVGGKRGGGKSRYLISSFAMGDITLPEDDPARSSFLNDRDFRGLFLREEFQSMAEFIEEAVEFFRPFGGKPTGKPTVLDFPSKARIYFNHLGDEEAFSKYKGWNLTKIGIEELTQIVTLRRYLKLLGSLRSVERVRNGKRYPELRTQIISTTNPDGPGSTWVRDRFVEVRDGKGKLIPWNTPMRDTISGMIRIFIPFGIESNPYLSDETSAGRRYRAMLMSQDEVTRKQWMEGDWNAGVGKFFKEYRPDGPIGQEEADKYPWAKHIVKPVDLKPWWFRWGSGDHGYAHPSAYYKFCRNESDKRVHVYDELVLRQVGAFEQGALLAKWWRPELLAAQRAGVDPSVTIHLGADAFNKTDDVKTKAQQIEAGIKEVLGPYGALLLKYDDVEREAAERDPKRAKMMFEIRQKELAGHVHIILKPAYIDRIAAWGYVREWLRFKPAILDLQTPEDREAYLRGVLQEEGMEAYESQAAALRKVQPEILPKVAIWEICKGLDRCLKVAMHDTRADSDPSKPSKREDILKFNADENGENGDDELEGFRNGVVAFKEIETTMPQSFWVAEKMAAIQTIQQAEFGGQVTDINRLIQMQTAQTAQYQKQNQPRGGTMVLPRRRVQ